MGIGETLWAFVRQPIPLVVVAAVVALCWPLASLLARWQRCSRSAATLFVASVGIIAALTLTPSTPAAGYSSGIFPHFLTLFHTTPGALRTQLLASPIDDEQKANIALYLPVGVFGHLIWRSVLNPTLVGLAITAIIELSQYGIVGRAGSLTDIRNNTLGALGGAIIAAAAVHLSRRAQAEKEPTHGHQSAESPAAYSCPGRAENGAGLPSRSRVTGS